MLLISQIQIWNPNGDSKGTKQIKQGWTAYLSAIAALDGGDGGEYNDAVAAGGGSYEWNHQWGVVCAGVGLWAGYVPVKGCGRFHAEFQGETAQPSLGP